MPSNCPHRIAHKCIDAQPSRRWLKWVAAPLGAFVGVTLMVLGNQTVRKFVVNKIDLGTSNTWFWIVLSVGLVIFVILIWRSLKDEEATSWAYLTKGFAAPSVPYLVFEAVVKFPLS